MSRNFILLALVFFLWGNITAINSVIILFFSDYFQISWQQAMLVTVLFYIAPFISCIPCAKLIARYGYRRMLEGSLLVCATGCMLIALSIHEVALKGAFLSIFIVAIGVSALQVVANPYLALLSTPEFRVRSLSLASAVNSLGTTLAPACIALLLKAHPTIASIHQEPMSGLWLLLALVALLLVVGAKMIQLPDVKVAPSSRSDKPDFLRRQPQALLCIVAIFLYVGVEVMLATSLLKYLTLSAGWSAEIAMSLITLYWGGSLAGRLLFGWFGNQSRSSAVFKCATLGCSLLVALAMVLNNAAGGWLLLLAGVGNSVMYPIIFTHGLGQQPQRANVLAGAMVMAGIGGAILPWMQAVMIERWCLQWSFVLPLGIYILLGMWGMRCLRQNASKAPSAPSSPQPQPSP